MCDRFKVVLVFKREVFYTCIHMSALEMSAFATRYTEVALQAYDANILARPKF